MKTNNITYHSDHLGSASFLTDNNGNETQQLVYLPFGEDWVDLKYNTQQFETPYKFNGKEKDLESGYNYYGARYYYDWLNIWLSVDPLSDRGPWISSYAYCFNNPIQLTDPDGKWPWEASHIKSARKFAKANNGHLSISKENGNKTANVITGSASAGNYSVTLSHFHGKNDSWGSKLSNTFSKIISKIDGLVQNGSGSDGGNRGGVNLKTNNPVPGIQGPAISTSATDIQSVNIDDFMSVLNVPSGNSGKMLNSALNMIDGFKAGSNVAGAIENILQEHKGGIISHDGERSESNPHFTPAVYTPYIDSKDSLRKVNKLKEQNIDFKVIPNE